MDGSTNNSVYQQVFDYNGFSRVGQASPNQVLGRTLGTSLFSQAEPPPARNRLPTRSYGPHTGWLLPAAVIAAAFILVVATAAADGPPTAGVPPWGTWLLALAVVFTISTTMNSYYAGAPSPVVAGLLGIGSALAWEHRGEARVAVVTAGTVLTTAGYAAWLLPTGGTGLPSGLAAVAIVRSLAAVLTLAWSRLPKSATLWTRPGGGDRTHSGGCRGPAGSAAASASVVVEGLGPFDTPFQSVDARRRLSTMSCPAALTAQPGGHRGGPRARPT